MANTNPFLCVVIFLVAAFCGLANSIPFPTLPSKVPPLPSLFPSPPPPPSKKTPPPPPPPCVAYLSPPPPPPPYHDVATPSPPPPYYDVNTPPPPPPYYDVATPPPPPPPYHPNYDIPPPYHPDYTPSPPPPYYPQYDTPPPPPTPYYPHDTPPPPPPPPTHEKSPPPPPKYPPSPPYKYIVTGKLVCTILSNYNLSMCKLPSLCPGIYGVPVYVYHRPTHTTIAQGITDSNGSYNIHIPPGVKVNDCVVYIKMPIKSCRILPNSGNLEAPINHIMNIDSQSMTVQFGTGLYVSTP